MVGLTICSYRSNLTSLLENNEVIYSNKNFLVLNSTKQKYPVRQFHLNENIILILEGKIYGESFESFTTELKTLDNEIIDEKLCKYAFTLDGEFYIYKININQNKISVFGDHLNRLPLYFGSKNNHWIISRQITTAQRFLTSKINTLNLAEFMVFDYNLSNRTWFENVFCLQIDDYIQVDAINNILQVKKKESIYNFETKRKIENNQVLLEEMSKTFIKACSDRAETTNVLSMSGGMDSRTVAAGLVKAKKHLRGVTFENAEKTALYDGIIAKEIADALSIKWDKVILTTDSFNTDITSLMKVKMSIQPCRFYFLYQFCNKVSNKLGNDITFFTGDGGDKVFPDLSKNLKFNNDLKLFKMIIKENHEFTIKQAAKITGTSETELENQIFSYIQTLPGTTSASKLEQFIIRARMKRYIFEGEDRNRNYFWSTSPFLSKDFFSLMMSVEPKTKMNKSFYFDFISLINPDVASIRNENYSKGKLQIGKGFYSFIKKISNQFLSRKSKEHLKSIFKNSYSPNSSAKKYILEINKLLPFNTFIDKRAIGRLTNYSTGQLSLILTYLKAHEIMNTYK